MTLNTYSHIFPSLDAAYRAAQEARHAAGQREAQVVTLW